MSDRLEDISCGSGTSRRGCFLEADVTMTEEQAAEAVTRIIADLSCRHGIGEAWDELESEEQQAMRAQWMTFIRDAYEGFR
jgi:hypothetical protein